MRETRLINKKKFDDPTDSLEAGSNEEFDLISEWSSYELVETIQDLDLSLYLLQEENTKLKQQIKLFSKELL